MTLIGSSSKRFIILAIFALAIVIANTAEDLNYGSAMK
jgi:hypothetical protein